MERRPIYEPRYNQSFPCTENKAMTESMLPHGDTYSTEGGDNDQRVVLTIELKMNRPRGCQREPVPQIAVCATSFTGNSANPRTVHKSFPTIVELSSTGVSSSTRVGKPGITPAISPVQSATQMPCTTVECPEVGVRLCSGPYDTNPVVYRTSESMLRLTPIPESSVPCEVQLPPTQTADTGHAKPGEIHVSTEHGMVQVCAKLSPEPGEEGDLQRRASVASGMVNQNTSLITLPYRKCPETSSICSGQGAQYPAAPSGTNLLRGQQGSAQHSATPSNTNLPRGHQVSVPCSISASNKPQTVCGTHTSSKSTFSSSSKGSSSIPCPDTANTPRPCPGDAHYPELLPSEQHHHHPHHHHETTKEAENHKNHHHHRAQIEESSLQNSQPMDQLTMSADSLNLTDRHETIDKKLEHSANTKSHDHHHH